MDFYDQLGLNKNFISGYKEENRLIVSSEYLDDKEIEGHVTIGTVYVNIATNEVCGIKTVDENIFNKEKAENYYHYVSPYIEFTKQYYNNNFDKKTPEDVMKKEAKKVGSSIVEEMKEIISREIVLAEDFEKKGKYYHRFLKYQKDENKAYLNKEDEKKIISKDKFY